MTKEQLIEQAKKLAESENITDALHQIGDLQKQWRSLGSEEESLYDKKMGDLFHGYLDQINARRNELFSSSEENKKSIIERAKAALEETNFKKAGGIFNDLMAEWKTAGKSTKETDDALWEEFNEVRNQFYTNRKAYMENLEEIHTKAKEIKEDIIARAKEVNLLENVKEKGEKMNALMEEWKKAGSAGRNDDESLWQLFSSERKTFNSARNEYYSNLRKQFAEKAEAKKQLLAAAKLNLARSEFTDEEVDAMKQLRKQWKEVGYAGKDNEEELWKEFNSTMNLYFENLKYYKD